jgi:multiple sugar transport system substrate-binding protein
MLQIAGFKESDIPKNWKEYWSFWCDKAQPALRRATGRRGYGIGMPMGVDSSDSFFSFLAFVDAYNVRLVDDDGWLLVDDPKVKQGLVAALADYTTPYIKSYSPPSSTSWKDVDNNVAFHNKTTIMTHNVTISTTCHDGAITGRGRDLSAAACLDEYFYGSCCGLRTPTSPSRSASASSPPPTRRGSC